jgi:hypothetical protein
MTTRELLVKVISEVEFHGLQLDSITYSRDEDLSSKIGKAKAYIRFILEFPEYTDDRPRSCTCNKICAERDAS